MAQTDRALFLYGFDVTIANQYINFKNSSGGAALTAVIPLGNYTCTNFLTQVATQMQIADPSNVYTATITRGVPAVNSNQVTISTSGSYLSLLFGTGVSAPNSCAGLLGFNYVDYTGHTSYTGYKNAGTILYPDYPVYDYLGPNEYVTNEMSKSISAAGIKETLVFTQMQFIEGNWKYINNFGSNSQLTQWEVFLKYCIKQLQFEFCQSVYEDPTTVYPVTFEAGAGGKDGGGYKLMLMNKDGLYRFYETGQMTFRVVPNIT
jgi:hypothetical protein